MSALSHDFDFCGLDYDEAAIRWAKIFMPEVNFMAVDLTSQSLSDETRYDSATLIEVLEHIEPQKVAVFLTAIKELLAPGAKLYCTVPHKNKPLIAKHYQHFTMQTLQDVLEPHFEIRDMFGFEIKTQLWKCYQKFTNNKFIHIEVPILSNLSFTSMLNKTEHHEKRCGRLFVELVT